MRRTGAIVERIIKEPGVQEILQIELMAPDDESYKAEAVLNLVNYGMYGDLGPHNSLPTVE